MEGRTCSASVGFSSQVDGLDFWYKFGVIKNPVSPQWPAQTGRERAVASHSGSRVCRGVVHRVSSSILGPMDHSFRALTGCLKFTVRRHKFNKDSLRCRGEETLLVRGLLLYRSCTARASRAFSGARAANSCSLRSSHTSSHRKCL